MLDTGQELSRFTAQEGLQVRLLQQCETNKNENKISNEKQSEQILTCSHTYRKESQFVCIAQQGGRFRRVR
jgi:hypothetical protein